MCGGDNSDNLGCGCFEPAALSYCEDTDGDGQGAGESINYCLTDLPEGWVADCSDPEPDCATNDADSCGVCAGSGIPDNACDCEGHVLDCTGECGGTAENCQSILNIDIVSGWNWFSLNVVADMSIGSVMNSLTSTEGDFIKSPSASSTYYEGFGWFGGLEVLGVTGMYKFNSANADELTFSGDPVDLQNTLIDLVSGWNWLGYTPQNDGPIDVALASITATAEDFIKNQTASAIFYDGGTGWFGGLQVLSPNEGYMLNVAAASTHNYPNFEPDDARDEFLTDLDDGIF